jgi:hypothetical protein
MTTHPPLAGRLDVVISREQLNVWTTSTQIEVLQHRVLAQELPTHWTMAFRLTGSMSRRSGPERLLRRLSRVNSSSTNLEQQSSREVSSERAYLWVI